MITQHATIVKTISSDAKVVNAVRVFTESYFDYLNAKNKPQINGIPLEGDKTFEELGLNPITKADLDSILV